jgi:hypothetical protein
LTFLGIVDGVIDIGTGGRPFACDESHDKVAGSSGVMVPVKLLYLPGLPVQVEVFNHVLF